MRKTILPDFTGGLNLGEQASIKDNELTVAQNFIYNSSKRLEGRKGYKPFGASIGNKPITSYFFHKRDDNGGKIAVAFAGTHMYVYDEATNAWIDKYSSFTEYEPEDPNKRTRWDFCVYKNTIYCCNGVDDYMAIEIPSGIVHTYPTQPKVRYIEYMNDTLFGAGEDINPNTLYYTNSQPTDGSVIDTHAVVIGGDEMGKINAIRQIGQVVLVGKDNKIYSVNIASESATPLDSMSGMFSNRSVQNVGNSLVYATRGGVDSLKARSGIDGAGALESILLSEKINSLLDDIQFRSLNSSCSFYSKDTKTYYFTYDSNGDDIPDSTVCYSSLTQGWTSSTLPPCYDYGFYIDDDNNYYYLLASANSGQMYQLETTYNDDTAYIDYVLETKNFDFTSPEIWKDFDYLDIIGSASIGSIIKVDVLIDDEVVANEEISGVNIFSSTSLLPLGTETIGSETIGGGGANDNEKFLYNKRIPLFGAGGGRNIRVRMYLNTINTTFSLDKMTFMFNNNVVDIAPNDIF